ncbi:unnamed protein product, partial [Heterobilharzia americana]
MQDSLKLKYIKQADPVKTFTKLELRVFVLVIAEIIISVAMSFVVYYLFASFLFLSHNYYSLFLFRHSKTLIDKFIWSKLILILCGILLGLLLVMVKPFQQRKPLNFFMLFTTVTILSMGQALLLMDTTLVEMSAAWVITLVISGVFFAIGFFGNFDITQWLGTYLIYVAVMYSVATIGAITLYVLPKRFEAFLLQAVSIVLGFVP